MGMTIYREVTNGVVAQSGGQLYCHQVSVAGSQRATKKVLIRLIVEAQKGRQRQVAPAVVMPVEKTQLLATVGRIMGRIQIDGDVSHLALTPSVSLDDRFRQCFGHPQKFAGTNGVFKSR